MSDLQFDQHQFYRRPFAVSAETCISYQDFGRMHLQRRGKPVWRRNKEKITWAFNNDTMRNVILTFLERRFFITRSVRAGATDQERIAAIEKAAKSYQADTQERVLSARLDAYKRAKDDGAPDKRLRELEIEAQIQDSKAMFDRRPVELLTNIVYLSYRYGHDSRTVAEQLHILPPHVRIILMRLNIIAADLATGRPYRQKSGKTRKPRDWSAEELRKLWFLRANGLSWAKCAVALGRSKFIRGYGQHGSNLIHVYARYFEQKLPLKVKEPKVKVTDKRLEWTRERLQGLWSLRVMGFTWNECGTVFGITGTGARGVFMHHLGKPRNDDRG